jgi:hypothetical protein
MWKEQRLRKVLWVWKNHRKWFSHVRRRASKEMARVKLSDTEASATLAVRRYDDSELAVGV